MNKSSLIRASVCGAFVLTLAPAVANASQVLTGTGHGYSQAQACDDGKTNALAGDFRVALGTEKIVNVSCRCGKGAVDPYDCFVSVTVSDQ